MAQQLAKTDALKTMVSKMGGQFALVLPKHLTSDKFNRVLFTAIQRVPQLAECQPDSVLASMMRAAEMGLLPDGRQGALVPLRIKGQQQCQFWPMWQGLLDLARQSGQVRDAYCASVYSNDEFRYQLGFNRDLIHVPAMGDRGELTHVYAVVELTSGAKTFGPGPMTVAEVDAIKRRARSQEGPWKTDYEPMAWKTVLKRVLKYVPMSPELQNAIEKDNEDYTDKEINITPTRQQEPSPTTQLADVRARLEAAESFVEPSPLDETEAMDGLAAAEKAGEEGKSNA